MTPKDTPHTATQGASEHPVFAYLLGEAPLFGKHFGDGIPVGEHGRFWWRKHLQAALAQRQPAPADPQAPSQESIRACLVEFMAATVSGTPDGMLQMRRQAARIRFYERIAKIRRRAEAALAASPQGASSLLPGWKLVPVEPTEEMVLAGVAAAHQEPAPSAPKRARNEYRAMLSASPLPAPQEPAKWHGLTEGERDKIVGDIIGYGTEFVGPLYAVVYGIERVLMERNAAPAPVDPESQGSQPASPARELTDAELTAIGAKHLEAYAQFVGAGDVWVEGEVEFARAVIAADRALRGQGR